MSSNLRINTAAKFSKKNFAGEVPLYLRITLNKDRTEVSLGRWILGKNWNPRLKRVVGIGASKINNYLEDEVAYLRGIKREFDIQENPYSVGDIKNKYLGLSNKGSINLIKKFEEYISYMKTLEGKSFTDGTIQNYRNTLKHLREFVQIKNHSSDIPVTLVDNNFIREYDSFLRVQKGHMHNTATKNLKRLKQIISDCQAMGSISINPFHRIKLGFKPSNKEALTETELRLFINKDFKLEKWNQVNDVFVFCCLTGLSFVDVKNLNPSNLVVLENGDLIIKGHRQKTDEKYVAYLLPVAKRILKKYENHPVCVQKGVLLPVLGNQKMNDILKEISAILEIDKHVSSHIARYTFITTVAISNGMTQSITGAVAGQSTLQMVEAYTKLDEMEVVRQMKMLEGKY